MALTQMDAMTMEIMRFKKLIHTTTRAVVTEKTTNLFVKMSS
jgi:hypothetical protein